MAETGWSMLEHILRYLEKSNMVWCITIFEWHGNMWKLLSVYIDVEKSMLRNLHHQLINRFQLKPKFVALNFSFTAGSIFMAFLLRVVIFDNVKG